MKPSELIQQTPPAQLSEVRREITGKAFRQEHSTRDKKRLLATIEEIELIIEKLGYQIKIHKMEKTTKEINKNTPIEKLKDSLDIHLYIEDKYSYLGIDYPYHNLPEYKQLEATILKKNKEVGNI